MCEVYVYRAWSICDKLKGLISERLRWQTLQCVNL